MILLLASDLAWGKVVLRVIGTSNMPDEPAGVPLMLTTEGIQVGSLKMTFELPPELDYLGTSVSDVAVAAGVTMKDQAGNPFSIELKGTDAGIPEGTVASMVLAIKFIAVPGSSLKLEPKVAATSVKGEPVAVEVVPGEVKVQGGMPQHH